MAVWQTFTWLKLKHAYLGERKDRGFFLQNAHQGYRARAALKSPTNTMQSKNSTLLQVVFAVLRIYRPGCSQSER